MSHGKIAAKHPEVRELEPGTYHWCACGRTQDQPFCDGSHAGSEFRPLRIEIAEAERVALCLCRRSSRAWRCDGSHKSL